MAGFRPSWRQIVILGILLRLLAAGRILSIPRVDPDAPQLGVSPPSDLPPALTTQTSSFSAVLEALALSDSGESLYPGGEDGYLSVGALHVPPLPALVAGAVHRASLWADAQARGLARLDGTYGVVAVLCFALLDVATASLVRKAAQLTGPNEKSFDAENREILEAGDPALGVREEGQGRVEQVVAMVQTRVRLPLLPWWRTSQEGEAYWPNVVGSVVMVHPHAVLACVALNTSAVTHLCAALALVLALRGHRATSMLAVAAAASCAVFPVWLALPVTLIVAKARSGRNAGVSDWCAAVLLLVVGLAVFAFVARQWTASWSFVKSSYLWPLEIVDFRPNIGLSWYLLIEAFDRYRRYFVMLFNAQPYLVVLPILVRLWRRPVAVAVFTYALHTLFQPYVNAGDIVFAGSLLLLVRGSIGRTAGSTVYLVVLTGVSVLIPLMWHVWINTGSGNANFYYNQTLVFNCLAGLLVLGTMAVTVTRDKAIRSALSRSAHRATSTPTESS